MSRKMIFVDTAICTGCKACSVACKAWNELPAENTQLITSYQSQDDFTVDTWTFVTFDEKYENGKFNWMMRKSQCFHCGEPACMKACSSEAISKTDSGFVVIDQDKCIGCGYCMANCPWNIPRVVQSTFPKDAKAFKCTGCVNRVENGLAPSCVSTCQPGALQFGDYDEMMALAYQTLAIRKENHPRAQLYGDKIMGGTGYLYLLEDDPEVYGLPANPKTPVSLKLWKDIVYPLGGIAAGAAVAAVAVGVISNAARGNYRNKPDHSEH
ncbi:MAG: 4Fe-4S dicluster domain-containing protein [Syntrophomonadaceae bacterium]|nr:4Fe-4S dicluster domain-containing protein [Syntrophomonadaceae bacterium]